MNWARSQNLLLAFSFILLGAGLNYSQQLRSPTRVQLNPFQVNWDVRMIDAETAEISMSYLQLNDKLKETAVTIIAKATAKQNVFEVTRTINSRNELFGFGEELLKQLLSKKQLIEDNLPTSFEFPYMLCRDGDLYRVVTHTETTEVLKLFQALNDIYVNKAIQRLEKKPMQEFSLTKLEIGRALTTQPRCSCTVAKK
jgi:hypothetical protein